MQHLRGAMSISPGMEYMERAYDDAKYGHFSRAAVYRHGHPQPDGSFGRASWQARACLASCSTRPTNWRKAPGTISREAFGNNVIDTIAEHAPNIKDIIIEKQVLTPLDMEREFGLTQGNIFQGELSLEQLFFLRPVPGWAYYRTPVNNLFMCGSATHPGGGIMGANGRIASQVILKEWKKAAN